MPWEWSLYTLQCWIMASFERKAAAKSVFFWNDWSLMTLLCVFAPFWKWQIISFHDAQVVDFFCQASSFSDSFTASVSNHLSTICTPEASTASIRVTRIWMKKTSLYIHIKSLSPQVWWFIGTSLKTEFPNSYRTSVTLCENPGSQNSSEAVQNPIRWAPDPVWNGVIAPHK